MAGRLGSTQTGLSAVKIAKPVKVMLPQKIGNRPDHAEHTAASIVIVDGMQKIPTINGNDCSQAESFIHNESFCEVT